MDDLTIIRRIQKGDIEAFETLVRKYHRNLLSFIFRIVKDSDLTEDIGQEVFLKVYQELHRFDPDRGTPFAAWLFIVARNQCLSELRKMVRTDPLTEAICQTLAHADKSAEAALIHREEMEALTACLVQLSEPFRTTLIMSLQGASLAEIADLVEVPVATIKTRLFRAKEKIKLLLKGHGGVRHEPNI